jgi:hypothetical protein
MTERETRPTSNEDRDDVQSDKELRFANLLPRDRELLEEKDKQIFTMTYVATPKRILILKTAIMF